MLGRGTGCLSFETEHWCPNCGAKFVSQARPQQGVEFRCGPCGVRHRKKKLKEYAAARKQRMSAGRTVEGK